MSVHPGVGIGRPISSDRYFAVHVWIRTHYPYVGRCEWCGCADKPTEYAVALKGCYTRNRADWFEFCRSCHRKFDNSGVCQRGKPKSPEHRAKMRKPKSPEHRAALSMSMQGRPAAFKGRKHTPEAIAKMRQAKLGKKASPETRAKMSASHRKELAQ